MKNIDGITYQDVLKMPIYERRNYIRFLNEDHEKEQEEYEKILSKQKNK